MHIEVNKLDPKDNKNEFIIDFRTESGEWSTKEFSDINTLVIEIRELMSEKTEFKTEEDNDE